MFGRGVDARQGGHFRGTEPPVGQVAAAPEVLIAEVEKSLDMLLAGTYADIPEGSDPLTRKIKESARAFQGRDGEWLRSLVHVSMEINESVASAVSEMTREMREVDSHAENIAAAAHEMTITINTIADSAERGVVSAREAETGSREGISSSERAEQTIQQIVASISQAAGKVDTLAAASEQIGQIVGQIEAIAKQTNLLALNATIEAARAGAAGKGFAVVAGEVKNLANQTSHATEDIRTRIARLRGDMDSIVVSMREGAAAVTRGQDAVTASANQVREAYKQVSHATKMMEEITEILHHQTHASSEVSKGIQTIAKMAAGNVAQVNILSDNMTSANGRTVPLLDSLCARQIPDATIHRAKSDHVIWKKNLAQMALGRLQLNPNELADHHHCRLGKWYDQVTDPGIRNHPAYRALEAPHQLVHKHGIEAARLYSARDLDGAEAEIEKVQTASKEVLRLLEELGNRRA
ncbi:MAG: methyl-accepting chemotaxis protein [Alphaproteobacteria bacterium]